MSTLSKATLTPLAGGKSQRLTGDPVPVQFNPASLKLQVTNHVEGGKQVNRAAEQRTGESSDTLTLELVFDTADEGTTAAPRSVRTWTAGVQQFVRPKPGNKPTTPRVQFAWGDFVFDGVMTSYTEDVDLFSSQGVPLRAKVQITILGQDPRQASKQRTQTDSNTGEHATLPGGLPVLHARVAQVDHITRALGGESAPQLAARVGLPPHAWKGLVTGPVSPLSLPAGHEVGFSEALEAALNLGVRAGIEAGLDGGLAERLGLPPLADATGAATTLLKAAGLSAEDAGFALSAAGGLRAAIRTVQAEEGRLSVTDTLRAFAAPAEAIAARIEGSPASDPRSQSFGRGVPLRAIVAGTTRAVAATEAVLGQLPRSDGPPAVRDPGVSPWQALQAAVGGGG